MHKISVGSFFTIMLFLMVIYAPFLDIFLNISTPPLKVENRQLASEPRLDIHYLDKFPPEGDAWFNDHFNFRNDLILINSWIKLNIFGITPYDKVAEGEDGWLFNAHEYLESYRSKDLFTDLELEKFKEAFEYRKKWLAENNIKFYISIPPNKPDIYEEFIPKYVYQKHGYSKYDQLKTYLEENTEIQIIDLKDALISKKSAGLLYYKTDPHWNDLGAFYAYQTIVERIQEDFPGIIPLKKENFTIRFDTIDGKVLARMLNMADEFMDVEAKLTPLISMKAKYGQKKNYPIPADFPYKGEYEMVRMVPGSAQPKALIIRDSFTNAMKIYFDETFSTTVYLWDEWKYRLNKEIVENEKPDLVLFIVVEKNLPMLLENIEEYELHDSLNTK